jgi:hypothetical protein
VRIDQSGKFSALTLAAGDGCEVHARRRDPQALLRAGEGEGGRRPIRSPRSRARSRSTTSSILQSTRTERRTSGLARSSSRPGCKITHDQAELICTSGLHGCGGDGRAEGAPHHEQPPRGRRRIEATHRRFSQPSRTPSFASTSDSVRAIPRPSTRPGPCSTRSSRTRTVTVSVAWAGSASIANSGSRRPRNRDDASAR